MYEKTVESLRERLGNNLLCAVKFGTEGEPNNFMCVLEKVDFATLETLKNVVQEQKEGVVPLFFTSGELKKAADVFPLEFLDIQYPHELLYGRDLVKEIRIEKTHVRSELEFELRSKLIHFRENYVWIRDSNGLKALLVAAVPSLMPLFYGLLHLKNATPPTQLGKLFDAVSEKYGFDIEVLKKIKLMKEDKAKMQYPELKKCAEELMGFLESAIQVIDRMKL